MVGLAPESWECKAQRTADPPQDCDWPTCGCDPYADKVIAALEESGCLANVKALAVSSSLARLQQEMEQQITGRHGRWSVESQIIWQWRDTLDQIQQQIGGER